MSDVFIISNNIKRDINEFRNQFEEYISKVFSYGVIELKDGTILRFYSRKELIGIRNWKNYSELYNYFLKHQNQELKKQLENKYEKVGTLTSELLYEENTKLINQQKEFIEYLEDLIKQNETVVEVSKYVLPKNCSKLLIDFYKVILSKYKEIIGGKDER